MRDLDEALEWARKVPVEGGWEIEDRPVMDYDPVWRASTDAPEATTSSRDRGGVDRLVRRESGRAVASLVRVLGGLDLAEAAVQDALMVALERWPREGVPDDPGAWITRVARNRAIDRLRRQRTLEVKTEVLAGSSGWAAEGEEEPSKVRRFPDDRLRLIFSCRGALPPRPGSRSRCAPSAA